ncbi:MAG: SAM-dependent chlorinase/fluorinase, partial [Synechococcales bacterium]|nr:SAM-dependent chlorinase/fluorinase [Synechococcales bacterium]
TDFGHQDIYVGVMKGVIAQISPAATVIDLCHEIPSQDCAAARFQLMAAYRYFPVGTIHVIVVDPGVGTQRRAIAIQTPTAYFIAPDNGVLSGILHHEEILAAIELNVPRYWLTIAPSATFQGRDIFAPVAAHLANGLPLYQLGTPMDPTTLQQLSIPPVATIDKGWQGCIQAIDHFGNLVTNIPGHLVTAFPAAPHWTVRYQEQIYPGYMTYGNAAIGQVLGLVGSHGYIELAVNHGNAQQQLNAMIGDAIAVLIDPSEFA